MPDYQAILDEIYTSLKKEENLGEVADYIPELAKTDANKFGIHLQLIDGQNFFVGDALEKFSIQSISKVLSLTLAFRLIGDNVLDRVGVEPSGNPFNSLSLLEWEEGVPRNPLINSGALVIADILVSNLKNPKQDFLDFVRKLTQDKSIDFNEKIARSERDTGFHNYATANLLKSYGNLNNEVEEVLDFYFYQCSIMMDCQQLSDVFFVFANSGKCIYNQQHLSFDKVKRINALMLTCGFYDEAGEFAFKVGLPGKSGVGGGIVAVMPNRFSIATWAPALNTKGNSYLGMKALEKFGIKTGLSIF